MTSAIRAGHLRIRNDLINHLRYSDLIAVKTRDFIGETSPRTSATRGLINSYCIRGDKLSFRV